MKQMDAGGLTQTLPSPGIGSLETDLQNVADAVAALLADARAIDPARDEFGHARSRAYSDAVALLKASAKVGHAIAELRGSKFEHNINVRREDTRVPQYSGTDEDDEATLITLNPDTLWDWRNKRTYVFDPTRRPDGSPGEAFQERGTPLPISGGSNGNFGTAAVPELEGASGRKARSP